MKSRLNREIKNFCPDFRPIRKILRSIGATFIGQKAQTDYFFFLPRAGRNRRSKRLKLRVQNDGSKLISYYDRNASGLRTVEVQVFEVHEPQIKEILETALGVKTVVKKQRQVWKKGNAKFHLDRVHDVGKVFEVELEAGSGVDVEEQIAYYRDLFGPHLGAPIIGSNEDLVARNDRGAPLRLG